MFRNEHFSKTIAKKFLEKNTTYRTLFYFINFFLQLISRLNKKIYIFFPRIFLILYSCITFILKQIISHDFCIKEKIKIQSTSTVTHVFFYLSSSFFFSAAILYIINTSTRIRRIHKSCTPREHTSSLYVLKLQ